jgi:LacI family transcriptional regulator
MQKATINDVASLADVSIKTVSRVVNQEPNVRKETRVRVEEAISRLNYRPNQSARNLARTRAHFIVLIYDDPSPYEIPSAGYIINLQEGALRACRKADYELLIHPCKYRESSFGAEISSLIDQVRPAGIILAAPLSNMQKIVKAIDSTGTPLIRLSSGKNINRQQSIATNDREVSAEMTRYLASLGHSRIAFITGHPKHLAVANRYLGYQDGMEQSGLRMSDRLVATGDNSFGSGLACAEKLLQSAKPPTAIFAANDDMAAAVIRVADRLGLKVPNQLSVAGFDDIALAQLVYPRLTTIQQPLATMTERAASILIEGKAATTSKSRAEIFPASLQIRESTGPAPE